MSSQAKKHFKRFQGLVGSLLKIEGPFLKGSIRTIKHSCGKSNCKCSRGQLHATTYLTVYKKGKQKTICLNARRRELLQKPLQDDQFYLAILKSLGVSYDNLILLFKKYRKENILDLDKIINQ